LIEKHRRKTMSTQTTEAGAQAICDELNDASTGAFLTEEQRNYAINRLGGLCNAQLAEFKKANPLPFRNRPTLTLDEMFCQVRDGVAKLIDLSKKKKACQLPSGDCTQWTQLWNFENTADQKAYDAASDKITKYASALNTRRDAAIDQLMLGSGSDSIKILAGFGPGSANPGAPAKA
jgi:hypothetical protein